MTARMFPVYAAGDMLVISGDEPTPPGTHAVQIADLMLADGEIADREGTFRLPLAELLFLPIFISAVRTFDPVAAPGRMTLGRTVIRRAHWTAPRTKSPPRATTWPTGRPARPPTARLRSFAARAQADARGLPEPGAGPRPAPLVRPRPNERPARGWSSPRCFPARTSAGWKTRPAATRASCDSSPSTSRGSLRRAARPTLPTRLRSWSTSR